MFASHSPFRHLRAEYPSLPPPSSAVPSLVLLVRNFPPRAFLALFPGKSRGKKVVLAVGTTLRKEGKCLPQFPFSSLFRVGTEDGFFELRSVGRTPSPTLILPFFRPPLSGYARALEGGEFPSSEGREGGPSASHVREGGRGARGGRKTNKEGRRGATFSRARCSDAATTVCYNGKRRVQILRFSFFGGVSQKKGPSHRLFRSLVVSQRAFDLPVAMLSE